VRENKDLMDSELRLKSKQQRQVRPQGEAPRSRQVPAVPYLEIENVHKTFGTFSALRDIYLKVYPGEFVCLLGPSGCGKTTLLRAIAGLERQTSGRIIQAGKDVSDLPPAQRDFGIVFQSYALFPNLTAAENVAYGLQNTKQSKTQIRSRVAELLETVGLTSFADKYPAKLSGGQQQRVALARALALSPSLLLLDEPLSALDAKVREKLRAEITGLQKRLGITTIMVTHDQAEALAMADRVVVMDRGVIAQVGTPQAIYRNPGTPFVADFIGIMNFVAGTLEAVDRFRCGDLALTVEENATVVAPAPAQIAIRPEDAKIVAAAGDELTNVVQATLLSAEFLGSGYRLSLELVGNARDIFYVDISSNEGRAIALEPATSLQVQLPPESIRIYPTEE